MNLCSVKEVKSLLAEFGLAPKKGFGQNFLINPDVPENIAEFSAGAAGKAPRAVLEIGPGVGALTSSLAERFDKVVCVEIDRGLIPLLERTLAEYPNVTVVSADFMELDLEAFFREHFDGFDVSVCANLPYYITTPVMMKFFDSFPASRPMPVSSLTFMVQLEVAERICSDSASGEYGSVTASVGLMAKGKKLFNVPAGNVYPAPSVTSAVMQLLPHENGIYTVYPDAPADAAECERFAADVKKVIAAAFSQRRKTLANALSSLYPKNEVAAALEACGHRPDIRGERLSSADFCRLTAALGGE